MTLTLSILYNGHPEISLVMAGRYFLQKKLVLAVISNLQYLVVTRPHAYTEGGEQQMLVHLTSHYELPWMGQKNMNTEKFLAVNEQDGRILLSKV